MKREERGGCAGRGHDEGANSLCPLDKIAFVYYTYIVYDIINIYWEIDNEPATDYIQSKTKF